VSAIAGSIVDWAKILDVIVASALAGTGVTVAFSLAIFGTARFSDRRGEHRYPAAAFFGLLAAFGYAFCIAGLVVGIVVMTNKS
jgi:cytochrome c biogenesis protein CcdA